MESVVHQALHENLDRMIGISRWYITLIKKLKAKSIASSTF